MRVIFFWITWNRPELNQGQAAAIRDMLDQRDIDSLVSDFVRPRMALIWMAVACLAIGIPLAFYFDSHPARPKSIGSGVEIFVAIMIVWSIIQLPVYLASIAVARQRCAGWLTELREQSRKLVVCEFVAGDAGDAGKIIFSGKYTRDQLKTNTERMRADVSGRVDDAKYWELLVRMLLNHASNAKRGPELQHSIDLCLSALLSIAIKSVQEGDRCVVRVQSNGTASVASYRGQKQVEAIELGKLPVKH